METEFIIRVVVGYGYLPILKVSGREVYRGEYAKTPEQALAWIIRARERYAAAMQQ